MDSIDEVVKLEFRNASEWTSEQTERVKKMLFDQAMALDNRANYGEVYTVGGLD